MTQVVGVRFRPVTKIYYFDPNGFNHLQMDDRVIVETSRGTEMGAVAMTVRDVSKDEVKGKLKKVIRKATPVDLMQAENYRAQEPAAQAKCEELVAKLKVPLKVLEASYSFDGARLVFSFVAEQRVDFRDLVKELARALHTRVEMKQVGARDETKIIDGYGRCGRRLCCSSWLTEFHPVSIRMAKNQGLPLAPSEISGLCGRLLCCLAYEDDFYAEMKKTLPNVGGIARVKGEGTEGQIRGVNVIKETVLLAIEEDDTINYLEVEAEQVDVIKEGSGKVRQKRRKKRKRKSNK